MPWTIVSAQVSPWATLDPSFVDFGAVLPGSHHQTSVRLRNNGPAPVGIAKLHTDCACLTAHPAAERIAPFESAQVRIDLNACDYLGDVCRHVYIEAQDPRAKALTVSVRYQVVPHVVARPQFLSLGLFDRSQDAQVQILPLDGRTTVLQRVACSHPGVEARIERAEAASAQPGEIHVHVASPEESGGFAATLLVHTDHPLVPVVRIPIEGECIRGLEADCRCVELGAIEPGQSAARQVTFRQSGDSVLRTVRPTAEDLDVVEITRRGAETRITVRTNPKLGLGSFHGHLEMEVFDGRVRKLRLPYVGRVAPATAATAETTSLPGAPSVAESAPSPRRSGCPAP